MGFFLFLLSLVIDAMPKDETISGFADRDATYVLVEANGVPAPAEATIRFPDEGRVSGRGPCNTYAASQTVPYPWIKIGAIASTRKTCPDQDFENIYFKALQAVTLAEVLDRVLILSDPGGLELVFIAQEP